ncbi:MAG: hypothetical protein PHT80_03815 [Lentisphaeria bacterium]|nr:hypothetical protein [Lentisphaeria bacterium]
MKNITIRSILIGTVFTALFAALTVVLDNRHYMLAAPNQVPLFPFVLLIALTVLINPLLRLCRFIKPLALSELLLVFAMCSVASGIATFGLTAQLVPIVSAVFNRHWNTDQTEWNRYVEPYLNENFFISEPGGQALAKQYAEKLAAAAHSRDLLSAENAKDAPDASAVKQLQNQIAQAEQDADALRQTLQEHREKAFAKVDVFRRGLPKGKRAYPGVLYTLKDDPASYFRRLARLKHGLQAAKIARKAPEDQDPPGALRQAATELDPVADDSALQQLLATLVAIDQELATAMHHIDEELIELNQRKRVAAMDDVRRMEADIDRLRKQRANKDQERLANSREQERLRQEITLCNLVANSAGELRSLADRWSTQAPTINANQLDGVLAAFSDFDASLHRYFLGDLPWHHWLRPLAWWGVIIALSYMILLSFNVLIFRQWAYHEKLIFPLAELPEFLAGFDSQLGDAEQQRSIIPPLFKSGLFWAGFAIAAGVMGWNLLCRTEWLPGLTALDLEKSWTPFIRNSMFKGLLYGARSSIFFTVIGIAFLIPQKVSFSLWFFHIFYMALLLILVAFGFGQNENSFPGEWWYTLNFRFAIGGGALLVFASLVLWKCRHMLLCALQPDKLENVSADERRELRISSALFLGGSMLLVFLLWRVMGVHLFYALFGYVIIMVITIGLIRAVAEGGIMGFQAWVSPFHLIRHICGFDHGVTAPPLFAPLMVYYAVLFLDIKAFIAPAMANALKIRDDLKMSRVRYHVAIVIAIAIAAVTAIAVALMMSYDTGADAMHNWFFTMFPKGLFTRIGDISKVPPTATWAGRLWLLFGASLMAALLYFRQTRFWLPHPIGLIMLVNPIMRTYWFSVLLGWLAKALVTRYSNKEGYRSVRCLFVGLIVGEFFIVAVAMILSLILQKRMGIDLNRN